MTEKQGIKMSNIRLGHTAHGLGFIANRLRVLLKHCISVGIFILSVSVHRALPAGHTVLQLPAASAVDVWQVKRSAIGAPLQATPQPELNLGWSPLSETPLG